MLEFYDGSFHYTYENENRIVTATLIGGGTETYSYNAEGQRIRKTNGTATIEYVYDKDGHQLGEMQPSGVMIGSEVWAGNRHLATYNSVPYQTVFIHADWQGTKRARTLYDGSGYQNCVNLPYGDGQICNTAPSDPSPLHYTGKMRDTETGLDYFGARYYGSNVGRFMSPDYSKTGDDPEPVPYADFEDPQSLNLYAYVRNNPLSRRDSTGHDCDPDTVSTNENGDTVVTAGACHYDWSTLMAGVVGIGHHYIPQQVFQNFDRVGNAYRFLNKVTTGALKNPKLSNSYDKLHRALNRQTDKVLRDLEHDLGKSAEDSRRATGRNWDRGSKWREKTCNRSMNGLQTLNPKPDRSDRLSQRHLKRFTRLPLKRAQRPVKPPEPQRKQE